MGRNKSVPRVDKRQYYLDIAYAVAQRSTCLRRKYGAVIVKNDVVVSTGYNGAPRGETNCCDTGSCERIAMNVPHGERYELCKSVHAEQNAIIFASGEQMLGATLYLVGIEDGKRIKPRPCSICRKLIQNAGIAEVVCEFDTKELRDYIEDKIAILKGDFKIKMDERDLEKLQKARNNGEVDQACRDIYNKYL